MIYFSFIKNKKEIQIALECCLAKINHSNAFALSKTYPRSTYPDIVTTAGLLQDSVLKKDYNIIDYPYLTVDKLRIYNVC